MRKIWLYSFLGLIILIFDQIFKNWAYTSLSGKPNFLVLGRFFSFEFYPNYGIAFGLPLPSPLFYLIILFIIGLLAYFYSLAWNKKDLIGIFAITLIFFGALSNLSDRLRLGYVVDYLNLAFWPVFNLADLLILAGVIILLIKNFKPKIKTSH